MSTRSADFELPLPLQPKERPRFSGHAYNSKKYRDWMKQCRAILGEWWTIPPLDKGQLLAVQFTFRGPGTSDLDNLCGAVMDAGKGILWVDDRVTILKRLVAEWEQAPKKKQSILLKVIFDDAHFSSFAKARAAQKDALAINVLEKSMVGMNRRQVAEAIVTGRLHPGLQVRINWELLK